MAEEGPEPRIDSTAPLETRWGVAFHFAPAPLTHHPLTLTEIPRSLLCPTWLRGSPDRLPAQLRAFCPHVEKVCKNFKLYLAPMSSDKKDGTVLKIE